MQRLLIPIFLSCMLISCTAGSYEEVGRYMEKNYLVKTLDKKTGIDKENLHIHGKYAVLNAPPRLADRSNRYEYFLDTGYVLCLQKQEGKWYVLYDLSRSDVPSKEELRTIKSEFPSEFPKQLLPEFWQERL